MTDPPESANDGDDPLFRPEDLEQWLGETPQPLVIDVEQIRMCSEQIELIRNEVIRIIKQTLTHIHAILPAMPIGRHLRLVTLRKLPGSLFLQSSKTPWGQGAALLHRGLRNLLVSTLNANGIPAERVPTDILEPESPSDPLSLLSVDIVVEDDPASTIVIVPPDVEMPEDGDYP
ncbi:hypothetical protein HYW11_01790, partial [Candidatus Peregrinibacteria bacterium]|nr:hypothetical protein [Candidatus Peregrinibacteria bacterium]